MSGNPDRKRRIPKKKKHHIGYRRAVGAGVFEIVLKRLVRKLPVVRKPHKYALASES
jgi:hypothetical protein